MLDQSLWRAHEPPPFPSQPLPREIDVAIVGAGITGLTAALLLKRSGKTVAVFDRERVGAGESGNTSAHLTMITDERISTLAERFGEGGAARAWQAGAVALDLIESNAAERNIACGFRRVPGFLCAPFVGPDDPAAAKALREDAALAERLGFDVSFHERGPVTGRPALRASDQAIFHPLDYLTGLAQAVDGSGCYVRDAAEVGEIIADPLAVIVDGENIACRDLVIATHVPKVGIQNLAGATLFQTKLYPYSSYILGARIDEDMLNPGLYNDVSNPYYFLRVHDTAAGRYAIFGGEDHKTGQHDDAESCYARLTEKLLEVLPTAKIERRWSGQVIETDDGLPFIGEVAPHQYVATGYAGNGLTFGTIAGAMMHDAVLGHENPWKELFDPHRKATSLGAVKRLVAENLDYPRYYIFDRLRQRKDKSGVQNVPRGSGKVITLDGQRVAVHRRENGDVVKVSAVCTHMGCLVRWNDAEHTWDCPCHGSRFTPEGLVVGGPAEAPLEKIE